MVKCEVLEDTVISVGKGSIVYVSERQFQLARNKLKPVLLPEEKAEVKDEEKKAEVKPIEKRKTTKKK